MIYPDWLRSMTRGKEAVFSRSEPVSGGISGGRTSMLLRFLCREHGTGEQYFGFQNTGREHSQTYLFLQRADRAALPVEWSEFRKPLEIGAAPKESRYEVVTPATAHRKGEPFEWMLEMLAEYRRAMGKTPERISGGPGMRLCSRYLKSRIAEKIANATWGEGACYTRFIGFRADEPTRIGKLLARETERRAFAAPLAEIGIKEQHVEMFWRDQSFTLECPANLGNCDMCFLKDQGDIAHNATELSLEAVQWWIDIQDKYGQFDASKDYRKLIDEAPAREEIRKMLYNKQPPYVPNGLTKRRFDLLVAQEVRRTRDGIQRMQCNCEASELLGDGEVLS